MRKNGWATIALYHWTGFQNDAGEMDFSQAVSGYVRSVNKEDIPLDLTRDSRWALEVYRSPKDDEPFYFVPGCRVTGVQLHDEKPKTIGFLQSPKKTEEKTT